MVKIRNHMIRSPPAFIGGRNPTPSFAGECIVGESGLPLVAATIHKRGQRSYLEWRAAEVQCGYALDGGLQDLVQSLAIQEAGPQVFVHPSVFSNGDLMGALKTALPSHTFFDLSQYPPQEGRIVVKPLQPSDHVVQVLPAAPTRTVLIL